MPKNLTLAIAALLIGGVSFGLGVLAQRSIFEQPRPSDTIFEHPRRDELLAAWKYPGAKLAQSADAGSHMYYGVFTTSDDINEVGKHYEKVLGMRVSAEESWQVIGRGGIAVASGSDSARADGNLRNVQVAVASQRTKDYVITVHLSRSKDEDITHIVLLCAQR
jgi:hypothetical protein